MDPKTLELIETAIVAVTAVRDHYEGVHKDYRRFETVGPNPLDMVDHSNSCLTHFLQAQHDLAVDAEGG